MDKLPQNPWLYFGVAAVALALVMYLAQSKTGTGE